MDKKVEIKVINGADFDAEKAEGSLLVMEFTRHEILSGRIGPTAARLMSLTDSRTAVVNWRNKVKLWFPGWDNDPRPLSQIPEVTKFFRELTKQWPYWLHFCEKQDNSIMLVMSLLCDVEPVHPATEKSSYAFKDLAQVQRTTIELFAKMNSLYASMGISEADNRKITVEVAKALEAMFAH